MTLDRKKKLLTGIALSVLIMLQLGRIVYVFSCEREGYHSDENWSYGYANSYFSPQVFSDDNDELTNFNTWTSSQVMRDYLEVNIGEEFAYDSVYFNQKKDLSPPLYSMLLHTVCSFFSETFSWYYAFAINMVVFIFTQLVLYFLCIGITKSRFVGLAACLYYGFTIGALNCFIYLRMYALLTLLALLSTYFHSRMYRKNFHGIGWVLALVIATGIVGGLTHYYFFIYSFFMTACFCIYLFIRKRYKIMLIYAGSILLSVVSVFALYPYAISRLLSGTSLYGLQMPYDYNLRFCLAVLVDEVSGISLVYPDIISISLFLYALVCLVFFLIPLCFLFRNEAWFIKGSRSLAIFIRNTYITIKTFVEKLKLEIPSIIFAIIASLAVITKISNSWGMNILMDRYLFFLMPLVCVVLVVCCYYAIDAIPVKLMLRRVLLTLLVAIILINNNIKTECNYLFKRNTENPPIEEITRNANCIVVTNQAWKLTYHASRLIETDLFFIMLDKECMQHREELSAINGSNPLYIVIETNNFPDENGKLKANESTVFEDLIGMGLDYTEQEFLYYLSELDWVSDVTYISTEESFVGDLNVYQISRK